MDDHFRRTEKEARVFRILSSREWGHQRALKHTNNILSSGHSPLLPHGHLCADYGRIGRCIDVYVRLGE